MSHQFFPWNNLETDFFTDGPVKVDAADYSIFVKLNYKLYPFFPPKFPDFQIVINTKFSNAYIIGKKCSLDFIALGTSRSDAHFMYPKLNMLTLKNNNVQTGKW